MQEEQYVSYKATGVYAVREHGYSAKIDNARFHARNCASHRTMRGELFGITYSGERVLLESFKWKKDKNKR